MVIFTQGRVLPGILPDRDLINRVPVSDIKLGIAPFPIPASQSRKNHWFAGATNHITTALQQAILGWSVNQIDCLVSRLNTAGHPAV